MEREHTDIELCADCMILAVNADASGMDDATEAACRAGLARVGDISANFDGETGEGESEFSWRPCQCCRSRLGGSRYRFAKWGA